MLRMCVHQMRDVQVHVHASLSGALQCSVTLYLTLDLMIACVFFTKD
jgi:hypothetical protein